MNLSKQKFLGRRPMIEVEVRAKIKNIKNITYLLGKVGAGFIKTEHQIDRIFGNDMFLDKNHKIIEGGVIARIRTVNNKTCLEFKEIKRKSGALEIQAPLSNVKEGIKLLDRLKFKEGFIIDKKRKTYKYKNFTICLDKVKKLGNFIEIECVIKSPRDKHKVRKECIKLLKKLSPASKIEHQKYGDLMQDSINRKK